MLIELVQHWKEHRTAQGPLYIPKTKGVAFDEMTVFFLNILKYKFNS